jgi:hypothetical protein
VSDKEIRDLDVSEEEGEDVKGGTKGPMPPAKNPGRPAVKSPGATAAGTPALTAAAAPKAPAKLPPGRLPPS